MLSAFLLVMISLSSDEVMLVASTFLESSPRLVGHHRPCSRDCRRGCVADAQGGAVYHLLAVVELSKFWSTLRVVPYR